MIRAIECYQTADGKIFPSEQQARRHADELLGKKLESFIEFAFPDLAHRPSQLKSALRMHENRETSAALLRELLYIMTYGGQ